MFIQVVRTIASYLIENPGFKVVLCGHSLGLSATFPTLLQAIRFFFCILIGGTMVSIIYYFLAVNKQFPGVKYELYTYGAPRVGNKQFAEFMNKQPIVSVRVVYR